MLFLISEGGNKNCVLLNNLFYLNKIFTLCFVIRKDEIEDTFTRITKESRRLYYDYEDYHMKFNILDIICCIFLHF